MRGYIRIIHAAPLQVLPYKYTYHIAEKFDGGKFDEFGKSSVIRQTKTIQISTYD